MSARLTWLGHSTVLVELDSARVLTDPVLRPRVLHLRRIGPVPRLEPRPLDAVLVSHVHWDHLDLRSLNRVGRPRLIVPAGAARIARRFGNVVEIAVDERIAVGALEITATYAEHETGRWRGRSTPALGFVIAGSRRIYFAGDTDLFVGMGELAPLDVALLPVAGWGPSLPRGHLNPRRAAEALSLLRPRVAVPIHWGTYAPMFGRAGSATAPPEEFERHAAELAPEVEVRVLPIGGRLEL